MSEPAAKKNPWWQFSLRSLLLLTLLVAAFFAGYAAAMRRVRLAEIHLQEQLQRAHLAELRAHEAIMAAEHERRFQIRKAKGN